MQIKKPVSNQPLPENAKRVFKGVIFDVYQWQQEGYDGNMKTFEKIKRANTARIICIREDKKIILAKQEQPGSLPFVDLIGGRLDEGEQPLEAAKRELLEETGYKSEDWTLFDSTEPVTKIEWSVYTFIAKGARKIAGQNLDGAEKIELLFVNFDDFVEFVLSEQFRKTDPALIIKILEAKLNPVKMAEIKKQFGL